MVWGLDCYVGPLAKALYEWIEIKKPLDPSIDINRFYKKMQ
jgi:hypothetical protein